MKLSGLSRYTLTETLESVKGARESGMKYKACRRELKGLEREPDPIDEDEESTK
jgi:hypothetical protein